MRICIICGLGSLVLVAAAAQGHERVGLSPLAPPPQPPGALQPCWARGGLAEPQPPRKDSRDVRLPQLKREGQRGGGGSSGLLQNFLRSARRPQKRAGQGVPRGTSSPTSGAPRSRLSHGVKLGKLWCFPLLAPQLKILPERPCCAWCFLATCRGGRPGAGWSWKGDGARGRRR